MLLEWSLTFFLPILAYQWAKRRQPEFAFTILGVTFGFIVLRLSIGLYAFYWCFCPNIDGINGPLYIGLPLGLSGLILMMFHWSPAFLVAKFFGFSSYSFVELKTGEDVIVELIRGLFWAVIYGLIGFAIDQFLKKRRLKSVKT